MKARKPAASMKLRVGNVKRKMDMALGFRRVITAEIERDNTTRPHLALGYFTPCAGYKQFYQSPQSEEALLTFRGRYISC